MSLDKVTFCNSDNYNEEYGIRYHCHLTGYAYYIIDDVKWLIDSRTMKPSIKYKDMIRRWIEIFEKNATDNDRPLPYWFYVKAGLTDEDPSDADTGIEDSDE